MHQHHKHVQCTEYGISLSFMCEQKLLLTWTVDISDSNGYILHVSDMVYKAASFLSICRFDSTAELYLFGFSAVLLWLRLWAPTVLINICHVKQSFSYNVVQIVTSFYAQCDNPLNKFWLCVVYRSLNKAVSKISSKTLLDIMPHINTSARYILRARLFLITSLSRDSRTSSVFVWGWIYLWAQVFSSCWSSHYSDYTSAAICLKMCKLYKHKMDSWPRQVSPWWVCSQQLWVQ